ncbi:ABC transporter ATP-binding protein [Parenemella sanctibonifatiensis]|uniref:ABC transporter ATP-binding protein n=1 Tax=Parenemella sanctibonifatiensis TaxID=2016505 RepID=A0A255EKN9_9ACTN|nr:ABC transporter ATP-binding protein [Parenemella sanctibonifatiensis]OYN92054.1 ABC transporter ATP-binding protein [Parenemella sanctibonifatiensis]
MTDNILEVDGLTTTFFTPEGEVPAVVDASFTLRRGRTLAIVGESGSGKSVTVRSVLGILSHPGKQVAGTVRFQPEVDGPTTDLSKLDVTGAEFRKIRGRQISMIFQEPMASLSPVHTIGNQISEMLEVHRGMSRKEARPLVIEALERVRIPRPEERIDAYTFQLSGGMRQRAMIAMALILEPALVIADEPTTALDVTTQAQILKLLAELKEEQGTSLIFITHDMGVVAQIADDVVVMRRGKVVESGDVHQIFANPQHEYTQQLLAAARLEIREPDQAAEVAEQAEPLLSVGHLSMTFASASGGIFSRKKEKVEAVKDVSLSLPAGSTFGLVGESGSGKTTLGRCVLRVYEPTEGKLLFRQGDSEVDLARLSGKQLRHFRSKIRMVFQDPYGSLNPRMTVRQIVEEPMLMLKGESTKAERGDQIAEMLRRVGLESAVMNRYPHAFSGGERQRICIARALITDPSLVVADEAVSALDVSVRAQVLELMAELQADLGLTYLFISHDLSVVERVCDDVAVMLHGEIVERGKVGDIFDNPQHDYTKSLLDAVPVPDPSQREAS